MTVGQVITCRAAVLWKPGDPFVIEQIEVDPPKAGEVRVKIVSTGICFSDVSGSTGKIMGVQFPIILGHEASGIVESIGEGVESVKPGDHVLPLFLPQCNRCRVCKDETANACLEFMGAQARGVMADGTSRFRCRGESLFSFVGCSTFTEYSVISEINLAKIAPEAPMNEVALISCGISTGYGAAINTAGVREGSTCAVWGLGTLGLSTIMGCKNAGAKTIIGIDINPDKFKLAGELGATEFVNPAELTVPIEQYLMEKYLGAIEYTFECIGRTQTMEQAFNSCALGNGVCVLIGVAELTATMPISPGQFLVGKTLKGSLYGGYKSRDAVPKLVGDFMNGKLNVSSFITHIMKLEDINEGFDLLKAGKSIRTILNM